MSSLSNKYKLTLLAFAFVSNYSFAEVTCVPQGQTDIENIKPITSQKHDKSTHSKSPMMKSGKTSKNDPGYLGILKILIPAGLR